MQEIFMDIKGYEGKYQVSNLGRVRNSKGKILKASQDGNGYMKLDLYKDGKAKTCKVHRLVLCTFVPIQDNTLEINHIDENKKNNTLANLEWISHKDNINHGTRNERVAEKLSIPIYCITNNTVYKSSREAARQLNLSQGNINECCRGKRRATCGFKFEYYNKEVE